MRRLLGGLTSMLLAMASVPVLAQTPAGYRDAPAIPDTPAYRRAREILELMNAWDAARARAYLASSVLPSRAEHEHEDDPIGFLRSIHDGGGRLELHGARSYDPPRPVTSAVMVVWNTLLETWQAIVVEVEAEAPHRIVRMDLSPARPPSDVPAAAAVSDAEIGRRVGALVDRLAARGLFSGTVLLARDGKPFLTRAVGIAHRDFDAPVKLDTKFNLGSMNKMFTGVAAMQLVEQGKLALDDPVSKYLGEDWLPKAILDRMTVRHLLTHTSGLGSYFNRTYVRSSRELFREVNDYRMLVNGDSLAFEPGTEWSYSNTGMLLAGAVIEKASGQNYFDYIREHVTAPAGMTRTDCYALDQVNPGLAVGYDRRVTDAGVEYENNLFRHVMRGGPAGGGYSTAEDLLRFDRALRSGKLLSEAGRAALWKAYPEIASPEYGLGFFVSDTPAGRTVGHSGGFSGISSNLEMYLDTRYTVVVMSNLGGASGAVTGMARRLLAAGRPERP